MAPAKDQVSPVAAVAISTSSGITSTFAVQPAAGAKCIAYVWATHASYGTITVTDNGNPGNTYVQDKSATTNASAPDVFMFRADSINLPSSGTLIVTIKASTTGGVLVGFAETFTGVATGGPTASTTNNGTTNADPNSGSATLASAGIYCAVMGCDGSSATNNIATTSPFTQEGVQQNGLTFDNGAGSDQVNVSGAKTCHWTFTTSGSNWNAAIVAYLATAVVVAPTRVVSRLPPRNPALKGRAVVARQPVSPVLVLAARGQLKPQNQRLRRPPVVALLPMPVLPSSRRPRPSNPVARSRSIVATKQIFPAPLTAIPRRPSRARALLARALPGVVRDTATEGPMEAYSSYGSYRYSTHVKFQQPFLAMGFPPLPGVPSAARGLLKLPNLVRRGLARIGRFFQPAAPPGAVLVFDYLYDPTGKALPNVTVTIRLTISAGQQISPLRPIMPIEIQAQTDGNGYWQVSVFPNPQVQPDSLYTVEVGGLLTYHISVPNTPGPFQSSQITAST